MNLSLLVEILLHLINYIPVTLGLAAISMLFASMLGFCVMLVRLKKIPVLCHIADLYVLLGRALPTMIMLYIVFFALPIALMAFADATGTTIDLKHISPAIFAIIGLTLHTGAYLTETFRSAVQSIDPGQMEAALSVGMTWGQGFRRIIFWQAAVFALPLMANQFLNLIKGTAIAFMITVIELFGASNVLSAENNRYLEVYTVVALLYWGMSIVFERLFLTLENKLSYFKKGM